MIGVLLVNLGSPARPTARAVRRYLKEFLMDPRVVDIPHWRRWPLVHLLIAPFRARRTASAYRKVWRDAGSPLVAHSQELAASVALHLGARYQVGLGMRYGEPSLKNALHGLLQSNVAEIRVVPLYPQYAASSTGSCLAALYQELAGRWNVPPISVLPPFYREDGFLESYAGLTRPFLAEIKPDHVLLSFHGLPERQIKKSDPTGKQCLQSADCCERAAAKEAGFCYRAQCFQTAAGMAEKLGLPAGQYSVSFQSRLGKTPWLRPYTDQVILELARQGKKRLVVVCPSFVADCLETLEEIGLRARDSFLSSGGERLELVPALNAHPLWVATLCDWISAGPFSLAGEADFSYNSARGGFSYG